MNFPDEMLKICRNMHQDVGVIAKSEEELIATALLGFDDRERQSVKEFLNGLFENRVDPLEVERAWNTSPVEIYFGSVEQLMWFLSRLRQSL